MSRWIALAFALGLAGVLIYLLTRQRSGTLTSTSAPTLAGSRSSVSPSPAQAAAASTANGPAAVEQSNPSSATSAITAAVTPMLASAPATATGLEFTNIPPQAVVESMRLALHTYESMFHENPVGDNSEIAAALNGKNPKQANFMKEESGMRLNAKGELVDPWGTPYFFHAESAHEMEIRSAGPDRTMYTADDIVTR